MYRVVYYMTAANKTSHKDFETYEEAMSFASRQLTGSIVEIRKL